MARNVMLDEVFRDSRHKYLGPEYIYTLEEVEEIIKKINGERHDINQLYRSLLGYNNIDYTGFTSRYEDKFEHMSKQIDYEKKYLEKNPHEKFKDLSQKLFDILNDISCRYGEIKDMLNTIHYSCVSVEYTTTRYGENNVEIDIIIKDTKFISIGDELSLELNKKLDDLLESSCRVKQENLLRLYKVYLCNELNKRLKNTFVAVLG